MRDFFQPWRRKVGCVTLVMALLFACSWIRSFVRHEGVAFSISGRKHMVHTRSGEILWVSHNPLGNPGPYAWSDAIEPNIDLDFGTLDAAYRPLHRQIPHFVITVPLLVVAAYLLLSKPRPAKKPAPTEPTEPDHA